VPGTEPPRISLPRQLAVVNCLTRTGLTGMLLTVLWLFKIIIFIIIVLSWKTLTTLADLGPLVGINGSLIKPFEWGLIPPRTSWTCYAEWFWCWFEVFSHFNLFIIFHLITVYPCQGHFYIIITRKWSPPFKDRTHDSLQTIKHHRWWLWAVLW